MFLAHFMLQFLYTCKKEKQSQYHLGVFGSISNIHVNKKTNHYVLEVILMLIMLLIYWTLCAHNISQQKAPSIQIRVSTWDGVQNYYKSYGHLAATPSSNFDQPPIVCLYERETSRILLLS